jgi:glycosyltransferase involved in cell wall biosynthesis
MTLDVSVIIPTYNQKPEYLTEAIQSALQQTYPREKYEILVVDDGSTRIPSDTVIAKFKDQNVRLIKKTHGGTGHTLNAGIRSMRGKYFKWLSSDDALCEQGLEILVKKAREAQEEWVIYGDWVRMDQNSNILNVQHEPVFTSVDEMKRFLWFRWFANGSATLIPKSAFAKVGMFDTSLPYYEDVDWWLRAIFIHNYVFVHADGVVAKYRVHLGQLSMRNGKRPLINWLLKKRLYTFPHEPSTFGSIPRPSVASLIRQMFLYDTARLFITLNRNKPVPHGLKKLKNTLVSM